MNAPEWHERGLCRETTPELFFPERGGNSAKITRAAKEVCAACPVTSQCLRWAVEIGDRYAILGGTTPDERKAMLDLRAERAA